MFGLVKSFISSHILGVVLCLIGTTLCAYGGYRFYKVKSAYEAAQAKNLALLEDVENLKGKIAVLETIEKADDSEAENLRTLLEACYKANESKNEQFELIDKLMGEKTTVPVVKEDVTYERITKHQNTVGIDNINNSLNSLRNR